MLNHVSPLCRWVGWLRSSLHTGSGRGTAGWSLKIMLISWHLVSLEILVTRTLIFWLQRWVKIHPLDDNTPTDDDFPETDHRTYVRLK